MALTWRNVSIDIYVNCSGTYMEKLPNKMKKTNVYTLSCLVALTCTTCLKTKNLDGINLNLYGFKHPCVFKCSL